MKAGWKKDHWWEGIAPWMFDAVLVKRRWTRPAGALDYDHDHCEFCHAKFADVSEGALTEGYTTADEARWVCPDLQASKVRWHDVHAFRAGCQLAVSNL